MKKFRISRLRAAVILLFIALTCAGLAWHTGWGTLSSFGLGSIAAICPLGGLETVLAGGSVTLRTALGILFALVVVLIFGRIFCGWMCPAPLIKKAGGKHEHRVIPIRALGVKTAEKGDGFSRTPYWVLLGALGSSAVFGFPVFCLICPVGLTFALVIGLWRLFAYNAADWSVLIFAAFLAIEFFVIRRWCHRLCPLGALMSLVSRANKTFRPVIDEKKCLRTKGLDCNVCRAACPEGIDLTKPLTAEALSRCTKCHVCSDVCHEKAISFPLYSAKAGKGIAENVVPAAEASAANAAEPEPAKFTLADAVAESERCIMCGECEKACPVHNPIPVWLAVLREGRPRKAGRMMLAGGGMPEICSRICPNEKLCEKSCSRAEAGGAIRVQLIERTVAEAALERGDFPGRRHRGVGINAVVVGAGPAGLACAGELAANGCAVTVFDAEREAGGLLTYGISPRKLDRSLTARRRAHLEREGVRFALGSRVGTDPSWEKLTNGFDAVFVASGAPVPVALDVPGADEKGVIAGIDYLKDCAKRVLGEPVSGVPSMKGLRVLVLGGGDTAADCAESALFEGAKSVTVAYRRTAEHLRIGAASRARLEKAGAVFKFGARPERVEKRAGGLEVFFADGTSAEADAVLVAFGFTAQPDKGLEALGVKFDEKGRIVTDPATHRTGCPKIWAGGDTVRGAALAAMAVGDGREAARSIQAELRGGKA
jgi:glutamate synthase (NADPH) small chain